MNTPPKKDTFKRTMHQAQQHMSPANRLFSRIIHIRAIEIISEVLAKTIFRAPAILGGTLVSIIFTLTTWIIAKHYGYQLSGLEPVVGFATGWFFGLLYDYASLIFISKKYK